MIDNIINLIIFIVSISTIAILLFLVFKLSLQKKNLMLEIDQAKIDRSLLSEKVATLAAEKDANALKEDDGFIRFLSNSRDWAFQYIETAQTAVKDFAEKMDPIAKKLEKSQNDDVKVMLEAYQELVKIIPDEDSVTTE